MSTLIETIEEAQEQAEKAGCIIIESDEHTILLDYDSEEAAKMLDVRREMLESIFGIESIERWASKSGNGHWHVKVKLLQKLNTGQRIAVQAACGSDPVRELFAVERDRLGERNPSILFQPKGAVIIEVYKWSKLFADIEPITDDLPF